jgi:thiol-disulfide isomerase/thioredoxin
LEFIQKLASPEPFQNEAEMKAYEEKASRTISVAADRALTKATTENHVSNAIGWKVEALRNMGRLGDAEAAADADRFLDRMSQDSRPAAKRAAARLRLNHSMEKWQEQTEAQRLAGLQKYAADVRANGLRLEDARLLRDYSIICGMMLFPTSAAAAGPYRDLLPLFRNHEDPKLVELTGQMEATVRRLELPGKKLELEGKLLDGSPLDWSALRGKAVLVDFWASDCGECMLEIPNLVKLYRAYHDKGFEIVGVNLDRDLALVKDIVAKSGIEWPQVFENDPSLGHWEHPLATKYAIDALPRMILVDKEGTVVHMNARGEILAEQLKKLLGEPAAAAADAKAPAVPDGSPAEIKAFVEKELQNITPPTNAEEQRQIVDKIRALLTSASQKILAGEPTTEQATEAIQMQMTAMAAAGAGNPIANQDAEAYLKRFEADPKPAVAGAVAQIRLMQSVSRWPGLSPAERTAALEKLVALTKQSEPSFAMLRLMLRLADGASEEGNAEAVARALEEIMPAYRASTNPQIVKGIATLEGVLRRINLPGKEMELEGTLMDGSKLDWKAYRGNVVLVDFWASWCGPCREEVPNIFRNYQAFHDKGFEVLGVCLDEQRAPAAAYIAQAGIPWPSLFHEDPANPESTHPMATRYGILGIPMAILLDKEGKVVTMMARGPFLEQHLKQLLGEPAEAPAEK